MTSTRARARPLGLATLFLLLVACSEEPGGGLIDAGDSRDGSTSGFDMGVATDGGTAPDTSVVLDAGAPNDSGAENDATVARDAASGMDAATSGDGGGPVTDAGLPPMCMPGESERELAAWSGRPYTVFVPSSYDCVSPIPVVLAIHGFGLDSDDMKRLTCPGGDTNSAECLHALGDREGFVTVYPNGTRELVGRSFNAGGGSGGFLCTNGTACATGVDDLQYFNDLLDDLSNVVVVNAARVYSTGISNGGAMSHRLACEIPQRIAAIASVSGANQFSATGTCNPGPVPAMQIHGTADPIWPYDGGGVIGSRVVGVEETIDGSNEITGWVTRNGCGATPTVTALPDVDTGDDSTVEKHVYGGCSQGAEVVLYKVIGGGHTWPNGHQYLSTFLVGVTNRDVSANEIIWAFFSAH